MITPVLATPSPEPILRALKKKRVLLVDSSHSQRDLRAETLRKLGIDVDCAADISEARFWWRAELYNLVLIDVENGLGHRDKFCEDMRSASPSQQLAFLVGKPAYLADAPNLEAFSVPISTPTLQSSLKLKEETNVRPSGDAVADRSQHWGILQASQRISAVRSASHARTKALGERPVPPRDSEVRVSKRSTVAQTLDELLKEEMQ
jgi:DNA-binding NtrC family response regulator